ncbi:MAG: serine/threonine protein kinase [Akkermansiaceae bacterium]|jgi:eukaryotic-like serine/threonine-protein kinase|nr:serine/threonine protein kinase [Akkermansiaceae bacterium]MDP4646772.1 serine/threonine protein kinase [Akkermansiaceae bacterium]MDP4720675.1 serine/threonine protein kinase [Akkermansiaceae bacterium]MDP4779689.1 serine/threonine protein kinase [Akkermansiaceae bacterium]MDP4897001.1 serine/threonine protein kinase [Akkermansiaceae bacterium]
MQVVSNDCPPAVLKKAKVRSFQIGLPYSSSDMPTGEEDNIIVCYACASPMDISSVAPYTRVVCPGCGVENRVKKHFGHYTVTRRHAIGGMSSVFVAIDETLDREVALKILSEEYSEDETRIAAFEQEARLTASFSHPSVVRVLTTGKAFGRFYIAMELVQGGHLEGMIRKQTQIPELEMLPLAIQIAEGLKGAQAAGLIHRDVKPGNILLDSDGHVKIVDFGLALVTQGGQATATEIWATPYYVPPEAIEGGAEDFRADIYAFGATLYHALAGKPPCDEETMVTNVLREAKKHILPLQQVAPDLLDETCAVVDRAMAYAPENRFSSYDDMIAGLKTALKAAKGEAETDEQGITRTERRAILRRRKKRNIVILAGAAVFILAATGTLIALASSKANDPLGNKPAVVVNNDPENEGNGSSPGDIAKRYFNARKAMESGDLKKAEFAFSQLLKDDNVEEPTRTWSGLQAVVAPMMDGRMDDARDKARKAREHLKSGDPNIPSEFLTAVLPVLDGFSSAPFFDAEEMAGDGGGNERFMSYLIAGLKNWEQGGLDQAVPFFQKVAGEKSLADDGVMGIFYDVAQSYLNDYELLSSQALNEDPTSVVECRNMTDELNKILTLLETKGRAKFNVKARLALLPHIGKELMAGRKPQQQPQRDDLEEIEKLAKSYEFIKLVQYIKGMKSSPSGTKKSSLLSVAESAVIFLSKIKSDLKKQALSVELSLADDTSATGIAINAEGQLVVQTSGGEVRDIEWIDLPADAMIAIHRELVKNPPNEMERLRRHETAISFDWLAGDRERALLAAVRLSEESKTFKKRWENLSKGLPE